MKALKILLHFVQSDSKLYSEFISLDGYKLLTKALTTSQIQPSCSMLMVYLFFFIIFNDNNIIITKY